MAKFTTDNQPENRGRKVGSPNKRTQKFRQQGNKLLDNLMDSALEGDYDAARLVLQFVPKPKSTFPPVTFETKATLTDTAKSVFGAVGNGSIAPDVGSQLIQALGGLTKIIELDELQERLERLENAAN